MKIYARTTTKSVRGSLAIIYARRGARGRPDAQVFDVVMKIPYRR